MFSNKPSGFSDSQQLECLKLAIKANDEVRVKEIISSDLVVSAAQKQDLSAQAMMHANKSSVIKDAIRSIIPTSKKPGQ